MLQKQIRRNDQEWCNEHNISISTFYNSIQRLRKKACEIPVSKGKSSGRLQQIFADWWRNMIPAETGLVYCNAFFLYRKTTERKVS